MTVYRRNPLLMTVMGANPGPRRPVLGNPGPSFIVIDKETGEVVFTRRATGVGSEAIASCVKKAHQLADFNHRVYTVFLDIHSLPRGHRVSVPMVYAMGITEEVHPAMRRNPIGEALLAGATSAVVSHALQSNPHIEGGPCPTCSGSLAYQGTLGDREHYRCRNCGMDFSTEIIRRRRYRGWRKTCGHGMITNRCPRCRGRRVPPGIKPCPHGVAGGGVRCVACQRFFRRGGPVQNNPAISRSWNSLKARPRLAILEFAGIPYDQASRLAGRAWESLPPDIQVDVSKGWQENPKRNGNYFGRREKGLRPSSVNTYCSLCGNWTSRYRPFHSMKTGEFAGKKLCNLCYQGAKESGEPWAKENPQPNPGSKRRMTMTVEKFAQWVKSKRDPVMWKAFLAKFRGYEKWTHGARAKKVTVEWVDTPGVNGLWITYDGGKQPESTYIMPKGVPRKGAWKHPWDTMPDIKHDPEAKIVITKLRGQSKITDFYHK